jgi:DNA-binding LytR/AlgR family response regulator
MIIIPVFISQNKKLVNINPYDIAFLHAQNNYTKLYLTEQRTFTLRSTISTMMTKLPKDIFVQIHRSFAVSILHIDDIEKETLRVYEEILPIGKQYYEGLIEKLQVLK